MESLLIWIVILGILAFAIYEYTKIKFYYNNKKSEEQLEKTIKMISIEVPDFDKKIDVDANKYEVVNIMIDNKIVIFRTDIKLKKKQKIKLFYKENVVTGTVTKANYKKDKIDFKTRPRKLKLYQERGKHEDK